MTHGRSNRSVHHGVEDGQRPHPVGRRRRELEPHRTADVVHHQVEAIELQRIDGLPAEAPERGPRVVEVRRPLREPEPRKVERDSA